MTSWSGDLSKVITLLKSLFWHFQTVKKTYSLHCYAYVHRVAKGDVIVVTPLMLEIHYYDCR